ncbi:MAG TPA: hypothetical protein VFQ44_29760 [Streptosporangiaceae bacterium]|nr:hypothetical protein [Streptosporangiaceae bacterium]
MRSSRVSMLARFGSAAAVAGLALAGALAPVSAASAATVHRHHRLASHLFIRAHAVPKTGHKSDVVVGLLRSHGHALAGRTVSLMSRTAHHKFALVSSAKTGKHGIVRFTVTPTTRTFYMLTFKGGPKFRGTHSAVIVLRAPKS